MTSKHTREQKLEEFEAAFERRHDEFTARAILVRQAKQNAHQRGQKAPSADDLTAALGDNLGASISQRHRPTRLASAQQEKGCSNGCFAK